MHTLLSRLRNTSIQHAVSAVAWKMSVVRAKRPQWHDLAPGTWPTIYDDLSKGAATRLRLQSKRMLRPDAQGGAHCNVASGRLCVYQVSSLMLRSNVLHALMTSCCSRAKRSTMHNANFISYGKMGGNPRRVYRRRAARPMAVSAPAAGLSSRRPILPVRPSAM